MISKNRGFKMGMLNINSLKRHLDELKIFMEGEPLDILAINETKIDYCTSDMQIHLPGYVCLRKDRNSHGGGVCIYLRNTLNYCRKTCLEIDDLEMISVEVKHPNAVPFLITTWYRPPKSNIDCFDKFEVFLRLADSTYKDIYILGDLNCNLLLNPPESHTSHLIDLLDNYQLSQLINEPTRVTSHCKSLIDHFITNDAEKILCSGTYPLSISDHNLIYGIRKIGIPRGNPKIITTRRFKNFDEVSFIHDLKSTQWPIVNNLTNIDNVWLDWKKYFTRDS